MKDDEVKLKQSVVFKNALADIENKISQGMTQNAIAEEMGMKLSTWKKYYMRFKSKTKSEPANQYQTFSHAKNNDEQVKEAEPVSQENQTAENKTSLGDILDPSKRSSSVSEFMMQKKPIGKGGIK